MTYDYGARSEARRAQSRAEAAEREAGAAKEENRRTKIAMEKMREDFNELTKRLEKRIEALEEELAPKTLDKPKGFRLE
jgi:hypothetical protein